MVDVPKPSKIKDTKQLKKAKDKATMIELPIKTNLNPKESTVEDILDLQQSSNQPSTSFPPKQNVNNSPKNMISFLAFSKDL